MKAKIFESIIDLKWPQMRCATKAQIGSQSHALIPGQKESTTFSRRFSEPFHFAF
jgi:hypothetical protein